MVRREGKHRKGRDWAAMAKNQDEWLTVEAILNGLLMI